MRTNILAKAFSAVVILALWPIISLGQPTKDICNSFEDSSSTVIIDTNGIWVIGEPMKAVFDSSYAGTNSIVTKLDSNYSDSDTSRFVMVYDEIPNNLGYYAPLVITMHHRFIMNDIGDFGQIEMSFNGGVNWYNVLSAEYNAPGFGAGGAYQNYHHFEGTGDTMQNSLAVMWNSNGWVNSKFTKDINAIIFSESGFNDTILLRFTFISNSAGNDEGWQVDELCMQVDYISGISASNKQLDVDLYPNPTSDYLIIKGIESQTTFNLFEVTGKIVRTGSVVEGDRLDLTDLQKGVYFLMLNQEQPTIFKVIKD